MAASKMSGQPLEIISVVKNKLVFHPDVLKQVLDKCGDRPLVIYSVAGEYRKGKSFLLNLFLLFNHHHQNCEDWMAKATGEIGGFEAKGGSKRVTSGIWMWSEPILSKTKSGTDVAILLMDTQGTFDQQTTPKVNSFIFGFSIAVSSVTMYNVKDRINQQDLDNLAAFIHSIQHLSGSFQSLKFIVRDWIDDEEYMYGPGGGKQMVNDMLRTGKNAERPTEEDIDDQEIEIADDAQLMVTREVITSSFPSITAFLLPLPGPKVSQSRSNPVKVKDMDVEFKRSVDQLCQELFVHNVTIRESADGQWTAEAFLASFNKFLDACKTDKLVDPGTLREAVGNKIAFAVHQYAFHEYMERIEKEIYAKQESTRQNFVDEEFLKNLDNVYREKAVEEFKLKVGRFGKFEKAQELLILNISKWFKEKESSNSERIKRKNLQDEGRKIAIEKRLLEIEFKKLQIEKDALEARDKAADARDLARENEKRERVRREEEENERRLMEEEMERERRENEEFERNQRENQDRINEIERNKSWWEKVIDFFKATWQRLVQSISG